MGKTIEQYEFLRKAVEQWPVRARRAGLKNKQLAKLAGITESHFSLIINFKVNNPRMSTINAVEQVLIDRGV